MARILILIGGHLCTAPRPLKEAETLSDNGHQVKVQGFWFNPKLVERDRALLADKKWSFEPIIDFQRNSYQGLCRNLSARARRRLALEAFKRGGKIFPSLLGYGAKAMLWAALKEKADLSIVHSEAGLWVGAELLSKGLRVGVDFEDWFSEDLLPDARAIRPIRELKRLERCLTHKCIYSLTTSSALANALSEAYQAPMPSVVYNVFPFAEREHLDHQSLDRRDKTLPSLHWFSQTIGPGRGLEMIFKALPYLQTAVEVHLRGEIDEDGRRWIQNITPSGWTEKKRIFIHETVNNRELLSRIAEHDIGLALEQIEVPSRNLTVTNKLFQYLQAGLAVVATDTAGQREVMRKCTAAGRLVRVNDPLALAESLNDLLCNPGALEAAKSAALDAAKNEFCWEKQSGLLLRASERALQ